jgi:hypothetical protein
MPETQSLLSVLDDALGIRRDGNPFMPGNGFSSVTSPPTWPSQPGNPYRPLPGEGFDSALSSLSAPGLPREEEQDHLVSVLSDRAGAAARSAARRVADGGEIGEYGNPWEDLEPTLRQRFPRFDVRQLRDIYHEARDDAFRAELVRLYAERSEGGGDLRTVRRSFRWMPFVGQAAEFGLSRAVRDSLERIQAGTATQGHYRTVGEAMAEAQAHARRGSMEKLTDFMETLPAFGLEIVATGGAFRIGSGVVMGARTAAEATLRRRILAYGLGSVASIPAMPQRVAASMETWRIPGFNVEQGELGPRLEIGPPVGAIEGLMLGIADTGIEIWTEGLGGPLMRAIGLHRLSGPGRAQFLRQAIFGRPGQGIATRLRVEGGLLGEYLEERAGEVIRGSTGLSQGYGTTGDIIGGVGEALAGDPSRLGQGLHDSMIELVAFGIFSGGINLAQRLADRPPRQGTPEYTALQETLARAQNLAQSSGQLADFQEQNREVLDYFGLTGEQAQPTETPQPPAAVPTEEPSATVPEYERPPSYRPGEETTEAPPQGPRLHPKLQQAVAFIQQQFPDLAANLGYVLEAPMEQMARERAPEDPRSGTMVSGYSFGSRDIRFSGERLASASQARVVELLAHELAHAAQQASGVTPEQYGAAPMRFEEESKRIAREVRAAFESGTARPPIPAPSTTPSLPPIGSTIEYQAGFPPKTVRGVVTRLQRDPTTGEVVPIVRIGQSEIETPAAEWHSPGSRIVSQEAVQPEAQSDTVDLEELFNRPILGGMTVADTMRDWAQRGRERTYQEWATQVLPAVQNPNLRRLLEQYGELLWQEEIAPQAQAPAQQTPRQRADALEAQHLDLLRRVQDAQRNEASLKDLVSKGFPKLKEFKEAKKERLALQKALRQLERDLETVRQEAAQQEPPTSQPTAQTTPVESIQAAIDANDLAALGRAAEAVGKLSRAEVANVFTTLTTMPAGGLAKAEMVRRLERWARNIIGTGLTTAGINLRGQALRGQAAPIVAEGSRTEIEAPGMGPVPARYAVVELRHLEPSHNFTTGQPVANPNYPPGLQPRDYAPGSAEAAKVLEYARQGKAGYFISSHPAADNGPPTMTPDGTVINGNGRTMALQRAAKLGRYRWYNDALTEQAASFGIDPKALKGIGRAPLVLVRIVEMDPNSQEAARLARAGNVPMTQAQSPVRTAASLNSLVNDEAINALRLEGDTTFSEAVTDPQRGRAFRDRLRRSLPSQQVAQYFHDDGRLTDAGIELVRNMLLARVFPVELLERLGETRKQLKRTLEGAVPQLIKLRRDFPQHDPTSQLVEALEVLARSERIKTVADADNALSQGSLFGGMAESVSPGGRMMLDFVLQDGARPLVFRRKLATLTDSLSQGTGLFAAEVPDAATQAAEALGVERREGTEFGTVQAAERHFQEEVETTGRAARESIQYASVPSRKRGPRRTPHPLEGKSKEQVIQELTTRGLMRPGAQWESADPFGFGSTENNPALEQEILAASQEIKAQKGQWQRPNISEVYARFAGRVSLFDFQAALARLQKVGALRLGPYTEALITHERPEHLMPLDREFKYFIEPSALTERHRASLTTVLTSMGVSRAETGEPETTEGSELLQRLRDDAKSGANRVGFRSIVEYLAGLVHTRLLVGRTQTSARHPAQYERTPHIVRSRTGFAQWNIHEVGHALSGWLRDEHPRWYAGISGRLVALTQADGSMASAETAEEGLAELVRRYVVSPNSLPQDLVNDFQEILERVNPEVLAGLRDARRAYQFHRSRPIGAQLTSIQNDKPPAAGWSETLARLFRRFLFVTFGGSTVIHRLKRLAFRGLSGQGAVEALDPTGLIGLTHAQLSAAHAANLKLGRAFQEEIKDTPADFESAYQSTLHISAEVARLLGAPSGQREGLRVRATGQGFGQLTPEALQALREAGFEIPVESATHGNWIYLTDFSPATVRQKIGEANWQGFMLYGQYRAALERHKKEQHDYPGLTEGLTPAKLKEWLAEHDQQHPEWQERFREVNRLMDQLLLVNVLGGAVTVKEAVKIKGKWEDYWPLPRQVEDFPGTGRTTGAELQTGVRRAWGSHLPFRSLDEALEHRVRMALSAYYQNRLRLAVKNFGAKLSKEDAAPFDLRKEMMQLMLPLHLEVRPAVRLTPEEEARLVARAMNEMTAREMGIPVDQLPPDVKVTPEDIQLSEPGQTIWRAKAPRAVHVVTTFEQGERRYYQVTDALLFDLFTLGKEPNKYLEWIARLGAGLIAPWKRAVTQNVGFAATNFLSRDPSNALFMGKEWRSLLPYYYAAAGALNRVHGDNLNEVSTAELYSRAADVTTRPGHRGIVGSFKEMLAEGIGAREPRWSAQWWADVPGRFMALAMKPIDVLNWMTGGRFLSTLGERLPREGAFLTARRGGASAERAQVEYDFITGNFGQRQGDPNAADLVRMAGFLNPTLQIMWGQAQRITDPDPARRAFYLGAKLPALAVWATVGAALNHLLLRVFYPDDDERRRVIEAMRERPDEDRLGYMAIGGRLRLPFDYGFIGAIQSWAWNVTEGRLLENPVRGETMARELISRATSLPGLTDVLNPYVKLHYELRSNYSFFFREDIVPTYLRERYPYNPELQTFPEMPDLYNRIGRGLRVSPIQVRYAVRSLFGRELGQVIQFADRLSQGRRLEGPQDLPALGTLFQREPRGYRSGSMQSLLDIDRQRQALANRVRELGQRPGANERDLVRLEEQIFRLGAGHRVLEEVEKIYHQVREERGRERPDQSRVQDLERQMTRRARDYLQNHGSAEDVARGRELYLLTHIRHLGEAPPTHLRRQTGESLDRYRQRQRAQAEELQAAQRVLSRHGVDLAEATRILRRNARGLNVSGSLDNLRRNFRSVRAPAGMNIGR